MISGNPWRFGPGRCLKGGDQGRLSTLGLEVPPGCGQVPVGRRMAAVKRLGRIWGYIDDYWSICRIYIYVWLVIYNYDSYIYINIYTGSSKIFWNGTPVGPVDHWFNKNHNIQHFSSRPFCAQVARNDAFWFWNPIYPKNPKTPRPREIQ